MALQKIECPCGQFCHGSRIFSKLSFPKSVVFVSSFVDTLSPLTAALHVVDLILKLLFLHCGYLGALICYFISSKHWYLENLSYSKKQQEQVQAQTKEYHQSINSGSLFKPSCS